MKHTRCLFPFLEGIIRLLGKSDFKMLRCNLEGHYLYLTGSEE